MLDGSPERRPADALDYDVEFAAQFGSNHRGAQTPQHLSRGGRVAGQRGHLGTRQIRELDRHPADPAGRASDQHTRCMTTHRRGGENISPHPLRARSLLWMSAGCRRMRVRRTMAHMAVVYRCPVGVMRQSVKPQRASWDRAGHPSQVKLGRFLAHVDAIAAPVLTTVHGRVAAELIVGFSAGVSLIDGGHDLGNYLFPVAQRLGPQRVAAVFGRKIHGPSSLAVGPAQPYTARATPQFSARMAGSYERKQWKQTLHDRLAVQAATLDPGPAGLTVALTIALTTGPGRNWVSLWKPLIAAFGPVLGEDPTRPFHPRDDRIVSLGLHHTIDARIGHHVIINAWWTSL